MFFIIYSKENKWMSMSHYIPEEKQLKTILRDESDFIPVRFSEHITEQEKSVRYAENRDRFSFYAANKYTSKSLWHTWE